jgi:hypothetical protein
MKFRTITGSIYSYDEENLKWERLESSPRSGRLRTVGGVVTHPATITVGQPAVFLGDPLTEGASKRVVCTSIVVEILGDPEA